MMVRRQKRELAGNTTPTDPRSQRIRESRKGRPCNEFGLSAHCLSTACPHLRAPGAPRPRWAHHNAVLRGEQRNEKAPHRYIPDNGLVESLNGRLRDECLNEHLFRSLPAARTIIEAWRVDYNTCRPHTSLDGLTQNAFATRSQQDQNQNGLWL